MSSSGAKNKAQLHIITDGSPDTISDTPDLVVNQIFKSNFDGLMAKKSITIDLENDQFTRGMLNFLKDAINENEPADGTVQKYENGTTAAAVTSASAFVRCAIIKYGGILDTGFVHVAVGAGYITNASWGHATANEERTQPKFEWKGVKQATGNAIALSVDVWDDAIVDITTPTPALPTEIAAATYGDDYDMAVAA